MKLSPRVFGILAICAALSVLAGRVDGRRAVAVERPGLSAYDGGAFLYDDEEEEDPNVIKMDPKIKAAVKRGLDWLEKNQRDDGTWDAGAYSLPITCMAGLAIASWAGPGRGPERYQKAIEKLTNFIMENTDNFGYISYGNSPTALYGDNRPAYGHAFSLLFLTQIYGMGFTPKEQARIRNGIIGAVRFIEQWQDPTGCWYQNYRNGHNVIVTVSHIQALRAANFAGFRVSKAVIRRALKYNETHVEGDSSQSRNASYTAVLLAAGEYKGRLLKKGVERVLDSCKKASTFQLDQISFANFNHLYASQVCYFMGGTSWQNYYNKISKWYLANQMPDGAWPELPKVHAVTPSRAYTTAVACLILQMPNRYLPMYQSVEPGEIGKRLLD